MKLFHKKHFRLADKLSELNSVFKDCGSSNHQINYLQMSDSLKEKLKKAGEEISKLKKKWFDELSSIGSKI